MNSEQANQIPLQEVLDLMGCKPISKTTETITYQSPFDKERKAIITVNVTTNKWHDSARGQSGTTSEFVCRYLRLKGEDATLVDSLRWLRNMTEGKTVVKPKLIRENDSVKLTLIRAEPLEDLALIRFLKKRGITVSFAKRHLKEVYIRNPANNTKVYALGFKNEEGGYAVWNPFLRGNIGEEDITFVRGKPKPDDIHIFKDCQDYLSFLTIRKGKHEADAIVLNSDTAIVGAIPYIKNYGYKTAHSWMDNTPTGKKMTRQLADFVKTETGLRLKPMNDVYAPHKDVSAWHMHNHNLSL